MNMIREINDVCKEVLTILAYCDEDLIEKIPNKVFKELKELAKDSKVDFYINTEEDLDMQEISEESKDLISVLYYNYVASEDEKEELSEIWKENENKYQQKLREKYNPDNIFQNRNISSSNTAMIEYKRETIFNKIKNFIKKHLKK